MIQRYKVEKGCIDKDDYGFYVHYADHRDEVERLTAEVARLSDRLTKKIELYDKAHHIVLKLCLTVKQERDELKKKAFQCSIEAENAKLKERLEGLLYGEGKDENAKENISPWCTCSDCYKKKCKVKA